MKRFLIARGSRCHLSHPVLAADVGVSVSIGHPASMADSISVIILSPKSFIVSRE